ncbi:MAG TPA: hypothetical protein PLH30_08035, partial [Bacteroidales bacterium]|nr:hypothetical protein [Bacteroidales bacterium]
TTVGMIIHQLIFISFSQYLYHFIRTPQSLTIATFPFLLHQSQENYYPFSLISADLKTQIHADYQLITNNLVLTLTINNL